MKKTIAASLSVLLMMSMMASTAVYAQEIPDAEQVIDIDMIDADTVPDADSYTIVDDGEPLLEVTRVKEPGVTAALDDTANEYYTADFMIPESSYQVYLTGLTQDNVSEIRQAIIASYVEGENFDLKNLGFIDAEKTEPGDGDDNMCWAATTANLLTYTGWAAQADFDSSDDLFEVFIDAFENKGGNVKFATGWFINGISTPELAQPREGTGRYLPRYHYNDLVEEFNLRQNAAEQLATVFDRLKTGYGASLSLNIYGSEGLEGGHAVTCWGFVTDVRYPETSKDYYKSVLVTDSDSDKMDVPLDADRRDADDVMSLFTLEPEVQEGLDTYRFRITDRQVALITSAVTVIPFSEEIPFETDPDATFDMINSPDITLDPFVLTDDLEDESTVTVFSPDATIYYQPYMMNTAKADYVGKISLRISVKDAQDNEIYAKVFTYSKDLTIPSSAGMRYDKESFHKKLPVGDYTITASFNMNHQTAEAYYFNNTRSINFKVREQYLLGDTNNDDSVDITDATKIQRILAYVETADDRIAQRGDVNQSGDLDLPDATLIMRYLTNVKIPYPIDDTRFYD